MIDSWKELMESIVSVFCTEGREAHMELTNSMENGNARSKKTLSIASLASIPRPRLPTVLKSCFEASACMLVRGLASHALLFDKADV